MTTQLTSNSFKPTTINGNLYLANDKTTLAEPNIVFTYNNVVYNITPAILQSLFTSSNASLQTQITTNATQITTLNNHTQFIYVVSNCTRFNSNIVPGYGYSIVLVQDSTETPQVDIPQIKFYDNSYINQLGNNVTNYFKNIIIASGCTLNGISTNVMGF